ncbi:MAG: hypothetical protein ISS15_19620 [Alphaproteobacteria bacterium]|nr:hypothetical protein [Alphaproteobacteria bacterium]MBL6938063.1 hypothetical protein [Alphaproteobacteria bacterium]MBL7099873.1 hypothetical protein [Alphaproteobacteria bacterium]
MGLDTVELVMAFEEAFDIEISDSDAEVMATVGDAVDHIATVLVRRGRSADSNAIYFRVREIVIRHLNVDPDKVTRSARFVQDLGAD